MSNSFAKNEIKNIILLLITAIVFFKIVFYNESFGIIIRVTLTLFYIMIMPGLAWLYYWREYLNFMQRFIVSFAVSLAMTGIFGYYFGLLGMNLRIFSYVMPAIFIICGYVFAFWKKNEKKSIG